MVVTRAGRRRRDGVGEEELDESSGSNRGEVRNLRGRRGLVEGIAVEDLLAVNTRLIFEPVTAPWKECKLAFCLSLSPKPAFSASRHRAKIAVKTQLPRSHPNWMISSCCASATSPDRRRGAQPANCISWGVGSQPQGDRPSERACQSPSPEQHRVCGVCHSSIHA
jgi:hypothetical protein